MTESLVAPELLNDTVRSILVVEKRQASVRDTAPHSHAPGQLIGSMTGLLSVSVSSGQLIVPSTHAIWIPPRLQHAIRSYGPFAGWSVYVDEAPCDALPSEARTLRVSALLLEAVHRVASWDRAPQSESERRLAAVILDEIAELPAQPLGLPHPRDERAARVATAIVTNLADTRSIDEWAGWAGLSSRTLARRFTEETGFGFTVWCQRARALRAIEMLADGTSVTTVAIDLGYNNVSAFIAMFRRTMGTTPGRYSRTMERCDRTSSR